MKHVNRFLGGHIYGVVVGDIVKVKMNPKVQMREHECGSTMALTPSTGLEAAICCHEREVNGAWTPYATCDCDFTAIQFLYTSPRQTLWIEANLLLNSGSED